MGQKAIKTLRHGEARLVSDTSLPRIRDDYILADTKAVALNPTDHAHINFISEPDTLAGCDWSGVIREVGKNVTTFSPGDEVFGFCHGGNNTDHEDGSFAETVACKESTTFHKPRHMSFEEAAALGVGVVTVGQTMYHLMGLPLPSENPQPESGPAILIYGGSSATGSIAIQAAKLSGCTVYTTCSPANFESVRSFGADRLFDYRSPDCVQDILRAAGERFHYVYDCVGTADTAAFCAQLISTEGGRYHSVLFPLNSNFKRLRPEPSVKATSALAYTMIGEAFSFVNDTIVPAEPDMAAFAKNWHVVVEPLIAQGLIKPHPLMVRDGGLQGVLEGLDEMQKKPPSGKKLVYPL